jgi:FkbM family methyltransferase
MNLFKGVELNGSFDNNILARFTITDWVQKLVYFFGTYIYEKHEIDEWKKCVPGSGLILDIGSNFGFYSLVASRINKDVKIVAFEPNPSMFERINHNIALNNFNNISVEQKGVSDRKGVLDFFISDDTNTGMSGLAKKSNSREETIQVEVTDIDSFLSENRFPAVSLVKIDVEGNEFNVLKGMKNVLKSDRPVLFIELYNDYLQSFGHSVSEVIVFMRDMNYSCFEFDKRGIMQQVKVPKDIPLAIFKPD